MRHFLFIVTFFVSVNVFAQFEPIRIEQVNASIERWITDTEFEVVYRTCLVYGPYGHNLAKRFVSVQGEKEISMRTDDAGCIKWLERMQLTDKSILAADKMTYVMFSRNIRVNDELVLTFPLYIMHEPRSRITYVLDGRFEKIPSDVQVRYSPDGVKAH